MKIEFTPAAEKFIRRLVMFDGGPGYGLRLHVSPGGCSGMSAEFSVEPAPQEGEQVYAHGQFNLFLPAQSRLAPRWRDDRLQGDAPPLPVSSSSIRKRRAAVARRPKRPLSRKHAEQRHGPWRGNATGGDRARRIFLPQPSSAKDFLAEASRLLHAAAMAYDDDEVALNHLMEARLLAPTHPATLIGLYRFYFYKGRLAEALAIAQDLPDTRGDRQFTAPRLARASPLRDARFWRLTTPWAPAFSCSA